jgi:hypothetical protein
MTFPLHLGLVGHQGDYLLYQDTKIHSINA